MLECQKNYWECFWKDWMSGQGGWPFYGGSILNHPHISVGPAY